MMLKTVIRFSPALLAAALIVGCEGEQRLYSYQAEDSQNPPEAPATSPFLEEVQGVPEPAGSLAPPENRGSFTGDMRDIELVGVQFAVPADWTETDVASPMRKLQLEIPPAEGATRGGEFVVFHFGLGQGGDSMANIQRWIGQMDVEPGTEPIIYIQELETGFKVSEVIVDGVLLPSSMGVGPTTAVQNTRLHGIVVEGGPEGSLFIKITGDRDRITGAEGAVAQMIASLRT